MKRTSLGMERRTTVRGGELPSFNPREHVRAAPATESWWIDKPSREAFKDALKKEQARVSASKFGSPSQQFGISDTL